MGMETIWIIGIGRFGLSAVKTLSGRKKERRFVLVDPIKKNLLRAEGPNRILEQCDGATFLKRHLKPEMDVSWIIPSVPVHLAFEWCRMKLGQDQIKGPQPLIGIESILPNPIKGVGNDVFVSHADFICPDNCSEPDRMCTVTGKNRKQDMFALLETLHYKDYTPVVLHSRQIGPGVGGYSPLQLFSFLKAVEQKKGSLLLCTACRCHGVITGIIRL